MPSLDGRTSPITTTGTPMSSMAIRAESALSGATAISNAPDAIGCGGSSASALQIVSASGKTGMCWRMTRSPRPAGTTSSTSPVASRLPWDHAVTVHDLTDLAAARAALTTLMPGSIRRREARARRSASTRPRSRSDFLVRGSRCPRWPRRLQQDQIADGDASLPHKASRGDLAEHLTDQNRAVEVLGDFRVPAAERDAQFLALDHHISHDRLGQFRASSVSAGRT